MSVRYTIGIDIGGTFTDASALASDGSVLTGKAPTTPRELERGVLAAIEDAARTVDRDLAGFLAATNSVKHASTIATNALITRSGARVGLLTTKGFEDTAFIMRGIGRVDGLDDEAVRHVMSVTKPVPLVQREDVRGVAERVDHLGQIVIPLNEDAARLAIRELLEIRRVESIAIALLQSWANPAHEERLGELVREAYPQIFVSLSSSLSRVPGEYGRTNTALANSFIGKIVISYLERLELELRRSGFSGEFLVMQGNGGLTTRAQCPPVATLQSGPAGGMFAASRMATELRHPRVITTDTGGTSFDVGVLLDGDWGFAEEAVFNRIRLMQPVPQVESIGAGGGTIATVDPETARLLVGPSSAGSEPGPACYGAGGTEPTVTDAALVLGYLNPEYFLGGRRKLHVELAESAIRERVGTLFGGDIVAAAAGIHEIINSKMADLIRREALRRGLAPSECVIYAFGGAGPVQAAGYARELGATTVYVFPSSSVLSAFGVAAADIRHSEVLSVRTGLRTDPMALNARLAETEKLLDRQVARDGVPESRRSFRRYASLRFARQAVDVVMPLPWETLTEERLGELGTRFVRLYEELYGSGSAYVGAGIELSTLRVDCIGQMEQPKLGARRPGTASPRKGVRRAHFDGRFHDAVIYDLDLLGPGAQLAGPAIVESAYTTIVVPPGAGLSIDEGGNAVLTLSRSGDA